jgi:ribosomal silencing factor RsfS
MPEQSPETRIALLENNHKNLMDKLDDFKEKESEHHEEIKALILDFKEEVKEALDKKANVWVEKAFSWVLYSIGAIIISAIMYLIVKFKL